MSGFNPKFADEDEQYLINLLQKSRGCFNIKCPKDAEDANLCCSKCKIAKYCCKDCQVLDWKDKIFPHKQVCKIYRDNVAPDNRPGIGNGQPGAVAIAFYSVGFIDEDMLKKAMTDRTDSFLEEAKRCLDAYTANDKYGFRKPNISLQAGVVWNMDKVRLQCAASFHDETDSGPDVVSVNHVVFEVVDDGDKARRDIQRGSGSISDECRERVLETLASFFRKVSEHGMLINSVTYGRGLMWMSDDKNASNTLEDANKGNLIMWLPDMQYSLM